MTLPNTPDIQKSLYAEVLKVHEDLGLVLGWAIVCTEDGEPYVDLQGDHIPEQAMLKAVADFMDNSRRHGIQHESDSGSIVFAFPMTSEIAKAFGIEVKKTGLLIAARPDKTDLEDFRSGKLTGFSIGGAVLPDGATEGEI